MSAIKVRYGVSRHQRQPWCVRFRWPFRSPFVVFKLHRFDIDIETGRDYHSDSCWCRREQP